jgi:hypothetical protein
MKMGLVAGPVGDENADFFQIREFSTPENSTTRNLEDNQNFID